MNNKGQAYSTFKLLIAAIVALAILMILLPIISSVLGILQNDPNDKARELINNLYNQPESLKHTEDVTFTPGYVLSAAALAEKVTLSSDQICITSGDFPDDDAGFELQEVGDPTYQRIVWHGETNKVVQIAVTCHINKNRLEDSIVGTVFDDLREEDLDCGSVCDAGRCCALALRASS
ncbi:MAG: hypothetical protein CL943_03520 [Candidatus Diapherotrites archaeon]|uniref:Uncharacterized protein n=1 Tax=Candidatus Iainarchaeum sp. TaxID=3101447 RepID=A0A2D6M1P3_9ARCH|nr:hypothetical protein [Candidatus Diapherotrites archaeon]